MAECPTCGDSFADEAGMKRHHTMTHGESLVTVTLTCSRCGDEFERPEYDVVEAENYYCSYDCRKNKGDYECPYDGCSYTSDSQLGIQQHHKRTHGESLTAKQCVCDNCGEEFNRQRSKVERYEATYCSTGCRVEDVAKLLRFKRIGSNNPMYARTGEDHPNYSGGYSQNYGEGWSEARRKTLERDDYECQDCGLSRDQHYELYGYDLEVHHKTPFRTFEDSAKANKPSNLITLCTHCHIKRE